MECICSFFVIVFQQLEPQRFLGLSYLVWFVGLIVGITVWYHVFGNRSAAGRVGGCGLLFCCYSNHNGHEIFIF